MKYETLERIIDSNTEEEARIVCTLLNDDFDLQEYESIKNKELWEKTLYKHHLDCLIRNVEDILM